MDIFVGCLFFVTQCEECFVINVKKLMLPQNICNDIKIVVRDLYRKQEIGFRVAFEKKGRKKLFIEFHRFNLV